MSNAVQRAATHIARKAAEMDIVAGKSPISVAAAAIYMASQVITFRYYIILNKFEIYIWVFMCHRKSNVA